MFVFLFVFLFFFLVIFFSFFSFFFDVIPTKNNTLLDKEGPSEKKRVQLLLVIEAIARVIKNELNRQLREKVNELKLPQEVFFFRFFF